jgi:hypothetical protein
MKPAAKALATNFVSPSQIQTLSFTRKGLLVKKHGSGVQVPYATEEVQSLRSHEKTAKRRLSLRSEPEFNYSLRCVLETHGF